MYLKGRAKSFKQDGNEFYEEKDYHNAIECYTRGIKEKSSDVTLNAILYCNRSAAQYRLGNIDWYHLLIHLLV